MKAQFLLKISIRESGLIITSELVTRGEVLGILVLTEIGSRLNSVFILSAHVGRNLKFSFFNGVFKCKLYLELDS